MELLLLTKECGVFLKSTKSNITTLSPTTHRAMARTTRYETTKVIPFSLVYGIEAILPTEIEVPTARMLLDEARDREAKLQELEEKREIMGSKMEEYHRRLALAYDKHVRLRVFLKGDLVLT
ncbi:uncharacterized protein LOC107621442 [Arachis ipaensis]|uniref:uncharacterized protein LOC107621442 n=1 Tax=Arachis ipaensis TaxID=130454 RepID=UPI0007AF3552|nr:uncharacterized protein LOC107621442 [Arachis ipaensis]XP_025685568.1 uncharacterized protein LOC112786404 [Arachis hypogaea]